LLCYANYREVVDCSKAVSMPFGWGRRPRRLYGSRYGTRRFTPMRARNYRGGGFGSTGISKRFSSRYRGAMYRSGASAAATRALRYTNWNARSEELKYLDINNANYLCGTTGAVTLINGVAAGSTAITREGRQCFWKTVQVSGTVAAADATVVASRADVFIVFDKQPGAAVPNMLDLFVESKSGSPMNLNYRERFVVLAHRNWVIGGPVADGVSITPNVHAVNINVKLNLRTTFKGDANAIGDIATGAMYLVTLGSAADASCAILNASVRMRFSER